MGVVVLWVSRHEPLEAQRLELKRKLGDVTLVIYKEKVPNAEFVIEMAKKVHAKYIVPVLPLSFIARLCELARHKGITILWAEMELLHSDRPEPCKEYDPYRDTIVAPNRHYRFRGFKKIKRVELVLEEW